MLRGKKILLGITGSIAAYKSILLVRLLIKEGADVKVICTPSALDFVTPITLSTLSKNALYSDFVTNHQTGEWANHVELGKWADLFVIAPLTANTLAKLCTGICDNLLLATYLSTDCPIMVAPAMDLDMFVHWTTQQNLELLAKRKVKIIDAETGELASGLEGKGRMAEPEEICEQIEEHFGSKSKLAGMTLLVTAGPTYERIDPVRFIGNYSSGKMGFAIAEEAASRGINVILVTGPTALSPKDNSIKCIRVESAKQMFDTTMEHAESCDLFVMAAAVADYRPKKIFDQKQKKSQSNMTQIELEETEDILGTLGTKKTGNPSMKNSKLIGFALETENELENAQKKLQNKNLDMLVMNSLNDTGAGFGTDTNRVTFVFKDRIQTEELKSKSNVAIDILDAIENL